MKLTAEERSELTRLTERNSDDRSPVAEHLVRALLALSPQFGAPDTKLALEHVTMAAKKLLHLEPRT